MLPVWATPLLRGLSELKGRSVRRLVGGPWVLSNMMCLCAIEMPYVGPYRVLWGPDERDRYALRDLHGRRFNEFHVSKLKLWPDDEEIDDEHYIVEHILDSRDHNGEKQYLVKWQG